MNTEQSGTDAGLDMAVGLDVLARRVLEFVETAREPVFIGIRTRGVYLALRMREQVRSRLGVDIPVGVLDITLYRDDISDVARQPVVHGTDIPFGLEGRDALLFDDVLFTGRTVHAAMTALGDLGRAHHLRLAVLVDRRLRELPIQADYIAFDYQAPADRRVLVKMSECDGEDKIVLI